MYFTTSENHFRNFVIREQLCFMIKCKLSLYVVFFFFNIFFKYFYCISSDNSVLPDIPIDRYLSLIFSLNLPYIPVSKKKRGKVFFFFKWEYLLKIVAPYTHTLSLFMKKIPWWSLLLEEVHNSLVSLTQGSIG